MSVIVIGLVCIDFVYIIYSLVNFFMSIRKAGKDNCVFKASLSQWIIHGSGILLVVGATFIFGEKGNKVWLLFLCLLCNVIADFIVKNTKIN